ncbi:MAG: STAS domain-containing protein, partial [Halomonas sp.]
NIVMLATVAVTVSTHNLAIGVFVGVLLAALFFANKVGNILYIGSKEVEAGKQREYQVVGQVFFASSERFTAAFDLKESIEKVTIDLSRAHFWDVTAVQALDRIVIKFRREGTQVVLIGLSEASATVVDRYAVHNDPVAVEKLMGGH